MTATSPANWSEVVTGDVGVARWGPLVISTDIDDAAIAVLRMWMPTHVRQLVKERKLDFTLTPPRQYDTVLVPQELLDNILPATVAQTTRMAATEGGMAKPYDGDWRLDIQTVVRGPRGGRTRYIASLYEGCTRRLMVQHAHESPIDWIHYLGMRFQEVPGDATRGRYLLSAISSFQVRTTEIVDPTAGPDEPDQPEYIDEPFATSRHIDVGPGRSPWTSE